jgi:hypothetical protein
VGEVIDLAEYKMRRAAVATARQALQAEREDIDRQVEAIHLARAQVETLTECCVRIRNQLATFSYDEKRLALAALDIRVTFDPEQPARITAAIPSGDIMSTSPQHV